MKVRTRHLFPAAMWVTLLLLPGRVWACACCAHPGEYQINLVKPDAYKRSVMERMRFGTTAYLFTGEAEPDDAAKGLVHPADTYSLSGSLVGNVWKLTFRNGDESGTLNLPLPAKILRYAADIHDGRTKPGYSEPVLYKEWRFEGEVNGTGFFKPGITGRTKYFLVLQGRGNSCDGAEDFTHWQLKIAGKKADYAFYGELGTPAPEKENEQRIRGWPNSHQTLGLAAKDGVFVLSVSPAKKDADPLIKELVSSLKLVPRNLDAQEAKRLSSEAKAQR